MNSGNNRPRPAQEKILPLDVARATLETRRATGDRIAFTNGCFDILHVGHTRYLQAARAYGDCLVVGLNSDRSVAQLKGPQRPIVPEAERAELLGALASVDYVVVFDEATPESLIASLRPDVYIKGGDYRAEDLPETALIHSLGGEVLIGPLERGKSTTNIVRKIQEMKT